MNKEKIKIKEPINMCNDAMFKGLFGNINNRGMVIEFLSAITGIKKEILKEADFEGGYIKKKKLVEKDKISDVIVKIDDNNRIIVEMNGSYDKNIFNKNSQYAFSLINETTPSNKRYSKVILINIDNFNKLKTKKCILTYKIRDEEGNIETEIYNSIHLVLENIVNKMYNKNIDERIIKFCRFLKMTKLEEMEERYKGDDEYMAAIRTVAELSTDPEFVGYYDLEEAHKQDIIDAKETGYDEGITQGISQRNIEIAKSLLNTNMTLEEIARHTGLTMKEIVKLKQ